MLIESTTSVEAPSPAAEPATPTGPHAGPTATLERAALALRAVDELGRRRRSRELVLALERLGAGLDATLTALDDATGAPVRSAAPAPVATHDRPSWTPISPPVVPITTFVPAPAREQAVLVAPAAPVVAPVPEAEQAPEARPMRQAPVGLAAHVIDFSRIVPA